MLMYIEGDPEEMSTFLKEFAHILTHTPVPPAGTVSVVGHCYVNIPTSMQFSEIYMAGKLARLAQLVAHFGLRFGVERFDSRI